MKLPGAFWTTQSTARRAGRAGWHHCSRHLGRRPQNEELARISLRGTVSDPAISFLHGCRGLAGACMLRGLSAGGLAERRTKWRHPQHEASAVQTQALPPLVAVSWGLLSTPGPRICLLVPERAAAWIPGCPGRSCWQLGWLTPHQAPWGRGGAEAAMWLQAWPFPLLDDSSSCALGLLHTLRM